LPNTLRIASLAWDVKATDIRAYDVRGLTLIADSFVICTATSEPQLKAVFNSVKEGMKEVGVTPLRAEGKTDGNWMILDYGNVIFHIFREEARLFYDLDGFWADAPGIDLELEE
jgi:ribosome-associated protein